MLGQIDGYVSERGRVRDVHVAVGALSGVCAEALRFAFEHLAPAEGFSAARLVVRDVPARFRCGACGNEYTTTDMESVCPRCNGIDRDVLEGTEFMLESLDVEE